MPDPRLAPQPSAVQTLFAPLSSLSCISPVDESIELVADHLAWLLNVHSVFNDEFVNIDYDPVLFRSPVIDDRLDGSILYKHLSIFSDEFLNALFSNLLLRVPDKTHGLHS